jgi:hypothetical protein
LLLRSQSSHESIDPLGDHNQYALKTATMMRFTDFFLLALALELKAVNGDASNVLPTVSIQSQPAYIGERFCVEQCLFDIDKYFDTPDYLPYFLGCGLPVYDSCYCTSDIYSSATGYISSCITSLCSDTSEVGNPKSLTRSYTNFADQRRDFLVQ